MKWSVTPRCIAPTTAAPAHRKPGTGGGMQKPSPKNQAAAEGSSGSKKRRRESLKDDADVRKLGENVQRRKGGEEGSAAGGHMSKGKHRAGRSPSGSANAQVEVRASTAAATEPKGTKEIPRGSKRPRTAPPASQGPSNTTDSKSQPSHGQVNKKKPAPSKPAGRPSRARARTTAGTHHRRRRSSGMPSPFAGLLDSTVFGMDPFCDDDYDVDEGNDWFDMVMDDDGEYDMMSDGYGTDDGELDHDGEDGDVVAGLPRARIVELDDDEVAESTTNKGKGSQSSGEHEKTDNTGIDTAETERGFRIRFKLPPGIKKDDLSWSIKDKKLVIRRKQPEPTQPDPTSASEVCSNLPASVVIRLPDTVNDGDGTLMEVVDGAVQILVPWKEGVTPNLLQVKQAYTLISTSCKGA
ncbi:hypothetical protein HDU96_002340 [Phlyctochytrium bullatum]|nr:hypothetical protein HDU96_002340 [Phlyctochytrium bullatum]